jgi:protein TonB
MTWPRATFAPRTRRLWRAGWFVLATIVFAACQRSSASATTPTPPVTVYEPGNGVSLPTLIKEVKPNYTAVAIANRIQGTVLLAAVVLPNGTVGDVTVLQSLDAAYGLDNQAVVASKQWLFAPGMKDGLPVAVRVTIEMTFTLRSQ